MQTFTSQRKDAIIRTKVLSRHRIVFCIENRYAENGGCGITQI